MEVVDAWINEDTGTPLDLAYALRDIGKRALAEVVAEKYSKWICTLNITLLYNIQRFVTKMAPLLISLQKY